MQFKTTFISTHYIKIDLYHATENPSAFELTMLWWKFEWKNWVCSKNNKQFLGQISLQWS